MSISHDYIGLQEEYNQYWPSRGYLPHAIKEQVGPYLLPYNHPAREHLDRIYTQSIAPKPTDINIIGRNIKVIKYPDLLELGLIIKEPRAYDINKYTYQLRRVEAHRAAQQFIQNKNITHVKVTQNWLYPLPIPADKLASLAYHSSKPIRSVLKALSFKPPKWLKYGDSILINRFVIIEEYITIQYASNSRLNKIPLAVSNEWKEVFEAVGFQDTNEMNYSLEDDDTITLFDLDQYSHKPEKNQRNGYAGISIIFNDRYHINI